MKCPICGCENPDDYKFCHDCGNPLILNDLNEKFDDLNNLDDFPSLDNKKMIIIGYVIAVLFGWGSFILSYLFGSYGFIGFIGLFFPGFMLNRYTKACIYSVGYYDNWNHCNIFSII